MRIYKIITLMTTVNKSREDDRTVPVVDALARASVAADSDGEVAAN